MDIIAVKAKVVTTKKSKCKEAGKTIITEDRVTKPITKEVCFNEMYSQAKSISFTSHSTALPSKSSRKPAFEYYTLTNDDMSDPYLTSGSASYSPRKSLFRTFVLGVF
jgi:hypothetical protein